MPLHNSVCLPHLGQGPVACTACTDFSLHALFRFWAREVLQLPCPCQALARACLHPTTSHRPTAAALLDCDFFPQPVRTAAFFLAALHPVSPPVECKWQMPISADSPTQAGISLLEAAPWLLGEALSLLWQDSFHASIAQVGMSVLKIAPWLLPMRILIIAFQ